MFDWIFFEFRPCTDFDFKPSICAVYTNRVLLTDMIYEQLWLKLRIHVRFSNGIIVYYILRWLDGIRGIVKAKSIN